MAETITVESTVQCPIAKVWTYWSEPQHIVNWNNASDDWHTPSAENDLRTGGRFSSIMAAKDGSASFEFGGVYDEVIPHKIIAYTMGDGRKVKVTFTPEGGQTRITETFEPEQVNSLELQKAGWQSILNNFRKYAEAN